MPVVFIELYNLPFRIPDKSLLVIIKSHFSSLRETLGYIKREKHNKKIPASLEQLITALCYHHF